MYNEIEKVNEDKHLRDLNIDKYRLFLYDTYKQDRLGKSILGYFFYDPKGFLLFSGEDFGCSPLHSIDSDEAVRSLLSFLTLRPGDTDADYFENYTENQLDFAQSIDCETMQFYTTDFGDYEDLYFAGFEDFEE